MKTSLFAASILSFLLMGAPVAGAGESISSVTDPQKAIQKEFQRHNYKKVIEVYREFVEKNPGKFLPIRTRVLYSESLAGTGEIEEAIRSLQEVISDWPTQVNLLQLQYDLANLLFMEKRHKEAREAYQKILIESARNREITAKARQRLSLMKEREARRRDVAQIQMLDIETSLEAGEVPDGAESFLQKIAEQNPHTPPAERATGLLARIREVRTEKARALLDEARRLYDEEKKYAEVREILGQIQERYNDVCEQQSVDALLKAVDVKEGNGRR